MSTPLRMMAMTPRMEVGVNLPNETKVAGEETMMPAFFRPMNAMNMPMPTEMACRRLKGMALRIASRMLRNVMSRKTMPSTSMMASDCCHV